MPSIPASGMCQWLGREALEPSVTDKTWNNPPIPRKSILEHLWNPTPFSCWKNGFFFFNFILEIPYQFRKSIERRRQRRVESHPVEHPWESSEASPGPFWRGDAISFPRTPQKKMNKKMKKKRRDGEEEENKTPSTICRRESRKRIPRIQKKCAVLDSVSFFFFFFKFEVFYFNDFFFLVRYGSTIGRN